MLRVDGIRLEDLRRSICMLPPQAPEGLSREDAMALTRRLQDAEDQLRRLCDWLRALLVVDGPRGKQVSSG